MLIPEMPKVRMNEMGNSTVPEATYTMRVHKAEYVPVPKNRSANPYIHAWIVITGPDEQFVGRMVFMNYTLTGGGSYRLRELLSVTGHDEGFELEAADQLLGLEFSASVVVAKGTNGYPDKNVIQRHMPLVEGEV